MLKFILETSPNRFYIFLWGSEGIKDFVCINEFLFEKKKEL